MARLRRLLDTLNLLDVDACAKAAEHDLEVADLVGRRQRFAWCGHVLQEDAVAGLDRGQRTAPAAWLPLLDALDCLGNLLDLCLRLFDDLGALEDRQAFGALDLLKRLADAGARLLELGLHLRAGALDETLAVGLERLELAGHLVARLRSLARGGLLGFAGLHHCLALAVEVRDQRLDGKPVGVDAGLGFVEDVRWHAEAAGDCECVGLPREADVQTVRGRQRLGVELDRCVRDARCDVRVCLQLAVVRRRDREATCIRACA